ncbi:MAG: hypothetical protein INH43_14365 [Acidobacteriaceae bacterium]|nr:hypothetical protein [Acidobacteriaceae bacterium]
MTIALLSLAHLLLIALANSAHPRWTHPDLLFAVTVPPGFRASPAGAALVRRYRQLGWAGTALLAPVVLLPPRLGPAFLLAILGGLAVWLAAFVLSRRATLPYAAPVDPVRTAALEPRPEEVPGGLFALLAPFAVLAARAYECHLSWEEMPLRFPIHWGLQGPDRWTAKTPAAVYGQFATFALLCAVMLYMAWATVHRARRITAPASAARAQQRYRRLSAGGLIGLGWIFALGFPPLDNMTLTLPYAPFLLLAMVAVWLVAMVRSTWSDMPGGDQTADQHWRLGVFYVNPEDPALLVEKRFGLGWTLNFANPISWVLLAAIVGVPLLGLLVIR